MTVPVPPAPAGEPHPLDLFLAHDPLVPGENREAYAALVQSLHDDLQPEGALQQVWTREVADLVWERQRLARLRADILTRARRAALWSILSSPLTSAAARRRLSALYDRWEQGDPDAVAHVVTLLAQKGRNLVDLVVIAHRDHFAELDGVERAMATLERRREHLLRQISGRQVFAAKVRDRMREHEDRLRLSRHDEQDYKHPPTQGDVIHELRAEGR